MRVCCLRPGILFALFAASILPSVAGEDLKEGASAYGDWHSDHPGVRRKISANDLPAPFQTPAASNGPHTVARPANAVPLVPQGFVAHLVASGLSGPRTIRVAPNGDLFVAETQAGRIRVLRAPDNLAKPERTEIFATGLGEPFGIAFYPPGPNPQFLYVASTERIVRFAYRNGVLRAKGSPEIVVPALPTGGGHSTRDIVFSPDGMEMFVSVGSATNNASGLPLLRPPEIQAIERKRGKGAAWGFEAERADVLVFSPTGANRRSFANGLRNCVGMALQPDKNTLWCAVNERDELGDNLPPDFVTSVRRGAFYGWPWYYIGAHQDPAHAHERSDLANVITIPDVLIQPHSAPLGITFYDGQQFPSDYRGDAFVALHGSWNRAKRTGYKIVRIRFNNGEPSGEYQDFATGFFVNDQGVWGRPVGVAVSKAGALLVSDDVNGTLWRISYGPEKALSRE
jgi:glucose/arabinose dehydrogenase